MNKNKENEEYEEIPAEVLEVIQKYNNEGQIIVLNFIKQLKKRGSHRASKKEWAEVMMKFHVNQKKYKSCIVDFLQH